MYLKASVNVYYYVDAAGTVQTIASPIVPAQYALKCLPGNWEDIEIKWGRNETYFGIFRSMATVPMEFIRDAAAICRKVFYTEGIEGKLLFVLEERDDITWEYSELFSGNVFFKGCKDELTKFTASVVEGGLAELIKANARTPYKIPLYDVDNLHVNMDGITLKNSSLLQLANDLSATNTWHQMMPVISVVTNESDIQVDVIEQPVQQGLGVTDLQQNFPFFRATENGDVVIDFDITINVTNSAGSSLGTMHFVMAIYHVDASGTALSEVKLYDEAAFVNYIGTNHATGTRTFTMNAGETLVYVAGLYSFNSSSGTSAFMVDQLYDYSTLRVAYFLRLPTTDTMGLRYHRVLERLTDQLSDGAHSASSSFLYDPTGVINYVDSKPYQVAVTSADALRQIPLPVLKITLADLFQDAHGRWLLGMGIDNSGNLIIEHLPYFFDGGLLIEDLGEVTDFSIELVEEHFFSQFKTGFQNQTYDNLNGRDEFNTTSVWKMPFSSFPGEEKDFVSPWRGDAMGIEFTRANLINKTTTDSSSDNDVFLIDIDTTTTGSAFNLRRPNDSMNTSGVIAPDRIYNVSLSPARNERRLEPLIHSLAYQRDAHPVTFQVGDKNNELISDIGSGPIEEDANRMVFDMPGILFKPYRLRFKTAAGSNFNTYMASSRNGYFAGTFRGKYFEGFTLDISRQPGKSSVKEWTLLATATFDESQFFQ